MCMCKRLLICVCDSQCCFARVAFTGFAELMTGMKNRGCFSRHCQRPYGPFRLNMNIIVNSCHFMLN